MHDMQSKFTKNKSNKNIRGGRAWCAAPDPPLQDVIGTM